MAAAGDRPSSAFACCLTASPCTELRRRTYDISAAIIDFTSSAYGSVPAVISNSAVLFEELVYNRQQEKWKW